MEKVFAMHVRPKDVSPKQSLNCRSDASSVLRHLGNPESMIKAMRPFGQRHPSLESRTEPAVSRTRRNIFMATGFRHAPGQYGVDEINSAKLKLSKCRIEARKKALALFEEREQGLKGNYG